MFTYLTASDLANRLGQDIDNWDSPTLARASSIIEDVTVFVGVLTGLEFDDDTTVPDRVRSAALSIAARHWLERSSDVTKERLGDWSQEYATPGTFVNEDDLTTFERTLLAPWLSQTSKFGQISVVPAFYGDSNVYVPVADTPEHFPLYEA